jgi:hypothetical protein
VITLKAMLRAERAARLAAEAEAGAGTLLIEKLKLTIKKLSHEQFGQSSERELRAVAVGRSGPARRSHLHSLNDIDPQAWLADVLARLPDHPAKRIHEFLPWNWRPERIDYAA